MSQCNLIHSRLIYSIYFKYITFLIFTFKTIVFVCERKQKDMQQIEEIEINF